MTDHITVIVDWKGPYSVEQVSKNAQWGNGLYMFAGKRKYKKTNEIQYCGITEGSFTGRFAQHHKLHEINRDLQIWLGSASYPQNASRHYLEMAEAIIVYFWQPALNEKKTVHAPKPVSVISRWFKQDGLPRMRQHPICKSIDDVLSWDGRLWRTGNLSVWED